ncbi:hypothetical protein ACDN41_12370 [Priestia aryabhattai]|uniref:hypothetical protein n=1 Tax=Priestia aryabhattai TaxID=412384 RepID=UPI0035324905
MYGSIANVHYKGTDWKFWVGCGSDSTRKEINDIGLKKLKRLDEEHPELAVFEIVDKINDGLL